ncbi:hypothetical protein OIN59_00550 [Acidovorax sp. D2M1]|uniref:Uncharacterized protein n=1 Tax=Acidovorax benzenivorans TaxID=2987520 RepID=A0ABT5RS01_9BURK|nr:hypothetical protein [Acidovorax benzenivorans]MDD2175897.1 hypothetical protein [Acidovorax benzenivorans]
MNEQSFEERMKLILEELNRRKIDTSPPMPRLEGTDEFHERAKLSHYDDPVHLIAALAH